MRVAFGTFLGVPKPEEFMGDRDFLTPRFGSSHVKCLAARDGGRLVGTNVVTRWGSFGFFGPLTVLPEYWNRGVAQHLLKATMRTFERWGVRQSGLYTFANSVKHVGLYQKFGYWPQYLTVLMNRPAGEKRVAGRRKPIAASTAPFSGSNLLRGLDLSGEIRAVKRKKLGEVIAVSGAFAICMTGAGTEGGSKTCYIKFGAARSGSQFEKLLAECEAFADERGLAIEAGVNLACEDAFRRMQARGYRAMAQGISMQRPNRPGFHRAGAYVLNDWR